MKLFVLSMVVMMVVCVHAQQESGGPFCPKCTELYSDDPAFPLPVPVGNTCSLNPEIEQCDVGDRCELVEIATSFIRDADLLTLTLSSFGCEQHSEFSMPIPDTGCTLEGVESSDPGIDPVNVPNFPELTISSQVRVTCLCDTPNYCASAPAGEGNKEEGKCSPEFASKDDMISERIRQMT
ncbi:uncharacterized protein LOC115925826 [Strongylocentrotus purpuratus]|uniref:Uncharacterized protein n=1 Tax=Strongylocentrotus purpuratus TaxID=7668 RepID=A0A7M7P5C2_STRPU|nr:uncharacterized protein LOC115925826 [Strongylocentrotus purpuratus]